MRLIIWQGLRLRAQFIDDTLAIRLARGDNVKEGFFHWGDKARFWPEITDELARYTLKCGDILIGMDGSKVGKNWCRVRRCDLPCLLVQRVARIRSTNSVGDAFITMLVSSQRFKDYVESVKTGTSIPHISSGQILHYEFTRPPIGDNRLLEAFEKVAGPLLGKADQNHCEAQTLVALSRCLLPKLISGELRVPDADGIVGRVT